MTQATVRGLAAASLMMLPLLTATPAPAATPPAPSAHRVSTTFAAAAKTQTKYTRTYGQVRSGYEVAFYQKEKLVGTLIGTYTQSEKLNSKSGTWKRTFSVKITKATGVATRPVRTTLKVSCGKGARSCKSSKAVTRSVSKGKTARFDFDITSYGKKINNHKPVLVISSVAAGYDPSVISAPALRTVRCDSEKITNGGKRGCVYPSVVPNFSLSRANPKWGAMAKHVYHAERTLNGKPGYAKPLHRAAPAQATKNRKKTCPSSLPRPKGKQCDEYPYASTKEGGGTLGKTQSRKMINAGHNRRGGTQLARFYNANRLIAGDAFYSRMS